MRSGETLTVCKTCRFWNHKNELTGFCRRHAPASGARGFEVARWPETRPLDGCGEGEPADTPPGAPGLDPPCNTCMFWIRPGFGIDPVNHGDRPRAWWEDAGFCRRFAPRPGVDIGDHAFWRVTHADDHCFDGRCA